MPVWLDVDGGIAVAWWLVVSPTEPPTTSATTATAVIVATLLASSPAAYALERASATTLGLTTTLAATSSEDSPAAASKAAGPSRRARVVDNGERSFLLGELDGERVVGLVCAVYLLIYCVSAMVRPEGRSRLPLPGIWKKQ